MKRSNRQLEKGAIDLIEEAVHLLRGAPLSVLAIYYMGALPFILSLLYFWADMSRPNPTRRISSFVASMRPGAPCRGAAKDTLPHEDSSGMPETPGGACR